MQFDGNLEPIRPHEWNVSEKFKERFARGKFVFGSAPTQVSNWIFLSKADVDRFSAPVDQPPHSKDQRERLPTRGRRPKYNWDAFHVEARRKLEDEGDFNPALDTVWNQARLGRPHA
jgi:hypothetical protein